MTTPPDQAQLLTDLFAHCADLVLVLDVDGRFLTANPAWGPTLGYDALDLASLSIWELVHPGDQAPMRAHFERLGAGEELGLQETRLLAVDGRTVTVEGHLRPRALDGGRVVVQGIWRDVSARKAAERMKDEVLATVCHDLRAPLTALKFSIDYLAHAGAVRRSPVADTMLPTAGKAVERLLRMTEDLLDNDRVLSGKVRVVPRTVAVQDLLLDASTTMADVAREAGVELVVEPASAHVWADADRCAQVLTNLVSNAVKFSPPGTCVTLRADREDAEVVVRVVDQGRGIPADQLEAIFEKYRQVEASDATTGRGLGLGLASARTLVGARGGRIWAESEGGRGSTFAFTLAAAMHPSRGGCLRRGR